MSTSKRSLSLPQRSPSPACARDDRPTCPAAEPRPARPSRPVGHQRSAEGPGLPPGSGTREAGRRGVRGEVPGLPRRQRRGQTGRSAGRRHRHARRDQAVRTVGSYWPYATTLFDYMRRAMPLTIRCR